ncbi:prephenate dehydratase [Bosea lathyri]|jgi:prephenate dehydratase|uniref:prephenate dehydratase n=1 Tax=Bosea lathyri TaxID=1036778 RepID=A0A1H5SNY7_9HYPH|nr:prephenate dehydratase [Bosea lathyri]SEF51678.1 prephenate dehydratase [Bosea lathyri]
MSVVVSYQGEPGAFSSQAALQVFPDCQLLPCATFEDALAAVSDGTARYGMIPIDNSIAGRVADIHNLLPNSGLHIIGENFLPIRFHLMAVKGATLATLKTVQSHIHALGQCRKIIRKLGLKAEVAADTAGSARQVAEANDVTRAAISPRIAAEVYGLEILMEDIEDEKHNTTRFVVLSKYPEFVRHGAGKTVTTLVFRVRNIPAALYKALGGFATNGINMTKLESYMVDGHFSATMFYLDVEGHPEDPDLKRALKELEYFSREMKILGVYPAHEFRSTLAEAGE